MRFARVQPVVPRSPAEGADNRVAAKIGAQLAHRPGAVGQMHAVEPEPVNETNVIGHHQRHVAGMGDAPQRVAGARDCVFI